MSCVVPLCQVSGNRNYFISSGLIIFRKFNYSVQNFYVGLVILVAIYADAYITVWCVCLILAIFSKFANGVNYYMKEYIDFSTAFFYCCHTVSLYIHKCNLILPLENYGVPCTDFNKTCQSSAASCTNYIQAGQKMWKVQRRINLCSH